MENKDEDLKPKGDESPENESNSENTQKAGDGLKDQKEDDPSKKADLLLDGTERNKTITIKKKTYDDHSAKAKLYETFAPLLDKVLKDPESVEEYLKTKDKGDLESRLSAIEEDRKIVKRAELKRAITEAINHYPDFEKSWEEVEPVMQALIGKGYSYSDAISRAFIAIHPEVAEAEKERIASEGLNKEGSFSFGGNPPKIKIQSDTKLTNDDKKIARIFGIKEDAYAKMMEKHKEWADKKFGEL